MAEFFLILGLILMTAMIFVVWIVARLIGFIVKTVAGIGRKDNRPALPQGSVACRRTGCRGVNPSHARFCRRCGAATGANATPAMRYVA